MNYKKSWQNTGTITLATTDNPIRFPNFSQFTGYPGLIFIYSLSYLNGHIIYGSI